MAVRAAAAPLVFYPVRMAPSGGSLPDGTPIFALCLAGGAAAPPPPRPPPLAYCFQCLQMRRHDRESAAVAAWGAASAAANAGTVRKQKGGREEDGKGWQAK